MGYSNRMNKGIFSVFSLIGFLCIQTTFALPAVANPKFRLKYEADSKAIHFQGRITPRAYKKIKELMKGGAETLVIDSRGGFIYPALSIANLVAKHELKVISSQVCYSACVLIFIAGKYRYALEHTKFGFHQIGIDNKGGFDEPGSPYYYRLRAKESSLKKRYIEMGIDPEFIHKAFSIPKKELWEPPLYELMKAKIITRLISSSEFNYYQPYRK